MFAGLVHANKPCSFYLEGCCHRSDCKFSHDICTITCHFWEEGQCFKGDLCPFLHGYFRFAPWLCSLVWRPLVPATTTRAFSFLACHHQGPFEFLLALCFSVFSGFLSLYLSITLSVSLSLSLFLSLPPPPPPLSLSPPSLSLSLRTNSSQNSIHQSCNCSNGKADYGKVYLCF